MKPLLANPALKPTAADVRSADAMAQDLLRLRFSTKLFRLGNAAAINAKVTFPVSGTADAKQGVIVMRIDDTVGADVDPALRGAVVVFNATPRRRVAEGGRTDRLGSAEPGPGRRRRQRRQAGGIRRRHAARSRCPPARSRSSSSRTDAARTPGPVPASAGTGPRRDRDRSGTGAVRA